MYNILSSIWTLLTNPNNANFFLVFATILLAIVTYMLVSVTKGLKDTAEKQYLGSMAVAFQNEWHDKEQWSMRKHLHSDEFKKKFDDIIQSIYDNVTTYKNINGLRNAQNLKKDPVTGNVRREKLFKDFMDGLGIMIPGTQFSSLEALHRVMISMDRLAFLRNYPFVFNDFIINYKKPFTKLRPILEACIEIERKLRDEKCHKEDLLELLDMLKVSEKN